VSPLVQEGLEASWEWSRWGIPLFLGFSFRPLVPTRHAVPGSSDYRSYSWNRLPGHAVSMRTLAERTSWLYRTVHAGTYYGTEWGANPYETGTLKTKAEQQWRIDHPTGKASEYNEDSECRS
jgi:hypothetical protein